MESFLEVGQVEAMKKGSAESFAENLAVQVSEHIGEDVTIFATHQGHAFGVTDDRVVKITWGADLKVENVDDVPLVTPGNRDLYVSRTLRSVTMALLGEGDVTGMRNQLHGIALSADGDECYWSADGVKMAENILKAESGACERAYEEAGDRVEQVLGEELGRIQARVPKTPYARIPRDRLEEFRPELRDSLHQIEKLADSLAADDGAPSLSEEHKSSLRELSRSIVVMRRHFKRAGTSEELFQIAECHDKIAACVRAMITMGEFQTKLDENGDDS